MGEINNNSDQMSTETIYLNVDDENGILKMNKKVFSKLNLDLILLRSSHQVLDQLDNLFITNVSNTVKKKFIIVIICDYHLENELGTDALDLITKWNIEKKKLNYDFIKFIQ